MKKIFLITAGYPFGFSEPFLENEIKILSCNFKEITIMPINNFGKIMEIPSNCSIIPYKKKRKKKKKLFKSNLSYSSK